MFHKPSFGCKSMPNSPVFIFLRVFLVSQIKPQFPLPGLLTQTRCLCKPFQRNARTQLDALVAGIREVSDCGEGCYAS